MNILFLSPAYYPPFPGGGERYVQALGMELVRQGYGVTVVTSCARQEQDLWQGCSEPEAHDQVVDEPSVVRRPLAPFPGGRSALLAWRKLMVLLSTLPVDQTKLLERMGRQFPAMPGLSAALEQLGPFDLVHAFNLSWETPALFGRAFCLRHRVPLVLTPFMHFGARPNDRVARNTTMKHQLHLLQQAQMLTVLTKSERDGLLQLGLMGDKIVPVGAGLDTLPSTIPNPDLICRRHGIDRPFVLFVGRNSYDKGAHHAVEAVLRLHRKGKDVQLVLAGQMTPEFRRYWHRLNTDAQRRIRRLGVIGEADKHSLLQACEALLLPSRTDSFGIVILEAWAHSRPVIAAEAGGIPGVIDDGQDGLLVPFGDIEGLSRAIRALLDAPDLSHRMGERGRTKVTQTYTWEKVACRVGAVYQSLVSEITSLPHGWEVT